MRSRRYPGTLAALAGALLALSGAAAAPAIRVVHADRAIGAEGPPLPLVEPHLAIDPADPDHFVAAAIAAGPTATGPWHCAVFTSFDAGTTWRRHDFAMDRCIDPWVTFVPGGSVIVTAIEIRRDVEGDARFELLQFASGDGGRTWTARPARLGRGHDHAMTATGSRGAVYLASRRAAGRPAGGVRHHLYVARTPAGSDAHEVVAEFEPGPGALNATGLAVFPDEALAVSYWEFQRQAGVEGADGMLPRARTFLVRRSDPDDAFSAPIAITDDCASGIEGAFPGYPGLARDEGSARWPDRLYHVCVAPGFDGVALTASSDRGLSWSRPLRVDRAAGRPARDARTAMVAVSPEGIVGVAWYDGGDDPGRGRCQDLHFTVSQDGGLTFAPAMRVNTERSCAGTPANGRVARSWPMGGDYGSLAAAPGGRFVLVWPDSRSGRFSLRTATLAAAPAQPASSGTEASYRRARAILERAQRLMGDAARIEAAGGLRIEAAGTLNKGAEHQGRAPGSLDPGPFRETLAIESSSGRVAYEYREDRYDGTYEHLREIYPGGQDRLIVLPDAQQVIALRSADHAAARRTLARRVPPLLVAEVLEQAAALRWLDGGGGVERISGVLATGEVVTLQFDARSGLLTAVEYLADVQGFGDTAVQWRFADYAEVADVGLLPRRYEIRIGGRPFTRMRVTRLSPAAAADLEPPAGYTASAPVDTGAAADASSRAAVQEIAPGIRRVTRLRQGFHPLFVEFADFVVALDAPAGYRLLNELPAGDVAPGASSSWLSERYIALIKAAVPDKPIRYVVLTHFHNDHLGGVRAFVAEGATVLAPPDAATVVRDLVEAPHTLAPDRLSRQPAPLRLEVVRGRRSISDGQRTLALIDVGRNPHGREMLVAHLPAERVLFVSDLVEPVAVDRYPLPSHAALDRFFARWLASSGLAPERIYTMHGAGLATPAHMQRLSPGA